MNTAKSKLGSELSSILRNRIQVTGIVQGVGFRPFVWTLATQCGLAGWVKNDSSGVQIEVVGTSNQIRKFLDGFQQAVPPLARVDSFSVSVPNFESNPSEPANGFQIIESSSSDNRSTPVSSEISICDHCLDELRNPANRRYRYPFINCTNCGPRFTIIEALPYDRRSTTMKSFVQCRQCQSEYDNPADRRFHAQPNACPSCGPAIWWVSKPWDPIKLTRVTAADSESALLAFRSAILSGQVVAVKGVGGFHLACDATNDNAVRRLRERKGRIDKPFAVMVPDVASARPFVEISQQEAWLLESKERPIVLLRKKALSDEPLTIQPSQFIAPGNNFVGVLLPYSPLHCLLLEDVPPLVMTSGNLTDEPIVRTNDEAFRRLGSLVDGFLLHDREIHVVCDDSVVRSAVGSRREDTAPVLPIRRSRGYAPVPIRLSTKGPSVLAVGGEIKSTFCVTRDDYAYMSQHIGDMENLETLEAMQRGVEHFLNLFNIDIEGVIADLHPDYLSGQWAKQFADARNLPFIRVQHHVAHVASLIGEYDVNQSNPSTEAHRPLDQNRPVIGVCFDGTGWGTDGAIWGGEFFLADRSNIRRFAHLDYFLLPGGDASIRRPYRVALSLLRSAGIEWAEQLACVKACQTSEKRLLAQQLAKEIQCVRTSSMGRLFDSVASIIGIRQTVNYEAQAAMEMESLANEAIDRVNPEAYSFCLSELKTDQTEFLGELHNPALAIGTARLIQNIVDDVIRKQPIEDIAAQFHHAVGKLIVDVGKIARDQTGCAAVGLTGGVFQNSLLVQLAQERLLENGFEVLTHSVVPPNDGGIAFGQAIEGRKRLRDSNDQS
jgi:hydrogenase maturation protein HypF